MKEAPILPDTGWRVHSDTEDAVLEIIQTSQPKNSTAKLLSGTNYWGRAHLAKIWEYTLKLFI